MRAFVYARYSSSNQREESIDAQLQACREYSAREGIVIEKIFVDEAESARYDARPGFQEMITAVKMGPPDMVLVHKLDRFSRNRYDAAVYRRKLKDYGVRLVSVLEPLDGSPESVILESVLEGMNEYYSRNLAREVAKGMRQTAQKGQWCGGRPPIGYVVGPDRKLAIEPEGAAVVRRIFDLFLDGYGYQAIAAQLNKEGLKTSQGTVWYKSSIHTILTNEKYAGVYVFNLRASAREDGSRNNHAYKEAADIIRIEGGVPVIIDAETWGRVQEKMAKRKKWPQPRRNGAYHYMLTGLLFCGECGGSIVGGGDRGKGYPYYTCTRKVTKACANPTIGRDWLESRVLFALKERVFTDSAIDSMVPQVLSELARRDETGADELLVLRAQIKSARAKIGRLIDMVEDGTAGPDVAARISERRAELDVLLARESELANRPVVKYTEDMIRAYLLTFRGYLESSDPALKRKALEAFVRRVEVFSDHVVLKFRVDPVAREDDDLPPASGGADRVGEGGAISTVSALGPDPVGESVCALRSIFLRVGKSGNGGRPTPPLTPLG